MKRILLLLIALLSINALQAQWRELHTGVTENLYDVCCVDTNTVFVCGQNGVILKTENGGDSWQELYRNEDLGLFRIKFANENVGFAEGSNGGSGVLLKTSDGGETWSEINNEIPFEYQHSDDLCGYWCPVDIIPVNADTIYIRTNRVLYKSEDGGNNFTIKYTGDDYYGDERLMGGYFFDNEGFLAEVLDSSSIGYDYTVRILKSSDYGNTWTCIFSQELLEISAIVFFNNLEAKIWGLFRGDTENPNIHLEMLETSNCFETDTIVWAYQVVMPTRFLMTSNIYGCYVQNLPQDKNEYQESSCNMDPRAFITKDGGYTWDETWFPNPMHNKHLLSVSAASDTSFYISSENGTVYKYDPNFPIQDIEETIAESKGVFLFPNPTRNKFFIIGEGIYKIEIYDLFGREIMSQTYSSSDKIKIDLFDMKDGIYIVKVYDKNGCNELKINKIK